MPGLSFVPVARRRWRLLALVTLAVLAAHGLLLFALAPAWIDPDEPLATAPTLSVRSVALPPVGIAAPAPPPARPAEGAVPKTVRAPRPAKPASSPLPPPVDAPPPIVVAAPMPPLDEPAGPAAVASALDAGAAAAIDLPVYATRLAQAGSWRFQLRRGIASGEAQLSWQPTPQGQYTLRLEGWIAGVTVLDWVSTGTLDNAGIAPERFAIRRRGRDNQAANFQRDAGKITFSGPTHEVPLLPGVQDRLTWMLQLPAVIEAAPDRFGLGARVVLMVIGARGGADVWNFAVAGAERVGDIPALKLVREARRPRETQVEIWLDPAQSHLPLRAVLTQPEGGAPLELLRLPSTGP